MLLSPAIRGFRRLARPGAFLPGLALLVLTAACEPGTGAADSSSTLHGAIEIDGSSTVFPITQAVAEEFRKLHPRVRVSVGVSGTGGGFKRFVTGETDISDASRPIKPSEEEAAARNGIHFIKLDVAFDGISIVVNPANLFLGCLTTEELRQIWEPGSRVSRWRDVRPDWPDRKIRLYGPDTDSGTFDYFTGAIMHEEDASRADYTASADDNVLIRGIAGDRNSLGYFGFAYYAESSDFLKLVGVDAGGGCVSPSTETIKTGTYEPLSRPLYIYVNKAALERVEVREFLVFYMEHAAELTAEVGYVPLPPAGYEQGLELIRAEFPPPALSGGVGGG